MPLTQVQRKLEFKVKKTARTQKKTTSQDAETTQEQKKSTRTSRASRRIKNKENCNDSPVVLSPRKRHSEDEENTENVPLQSTPSPSKKKKEKELIARRDETPIRSSLAVKFAAAKVTDEQNDTENKLTAKENVLKSMCSPKKSSARRPTLCDQVLSVKSVKENSPLKKSPGIKLGRQDCVAYHQAKQSFHTAKPDRLIGRDSETTEVRTFLKGHMTKKTSGSLYISGAPGTGKTAVLTSIIDEMKGVHGCKTVYLNCMTLESSAGVYGKVYSDLTGKNAPTAKERLRAVERLLCSDGPSMYEENTENVPLQSTPSPSKKKKEKELIARRDETPIRSSLAVKFAAAKVTDEQNDTENKLTAKENVLKSMCSPKKSSARRPTLCDQVLSVKSVKENSPLKKSPGIKLGRQDCVAYHQAKQSFHTAKPDRLIGRDSETTEVRTFLKGHMTKKTSGSLYISGAPGTGKTAVLTSIIDEMKGVHGCKTVYLNCMTLESSAGVYGKVYSDLTGKNAPTAKERLRAVERLLCSDGPSIVMVLDEIDQLDSKSQEILYTIFEWPSLPKSRLILIGIANALDLTDRVLPRLQARPNCRPQLLNFAPYTKDQISAIIKDRLKHLEEEGTAVMDSTAIQFCARKISAVAGDMRKALDVCRRAVELVESDVKSQRVLKSTDSISNSPVKQQSPAVPKKIGVLHISNVLSDVYGTGAQAQQHETVPLQQKLVVCSLLLLMKQAKNKEVTVGKLHEIYSKVCRGRQMAPMDQSEFQGIVTLLDARGILGMKKAKEARMSKVSLKLNERELEHTLQDKVLMSAILKEGIPK